MEATKVGSGSPLSCDSFLSSVASWQLAVSPAARRCCGSRSALKRSSAGKVGWSSGAEVPFGYSHQVGSAMSVIHDPPSGAAPARPWTTLGSELRLVVIPSAPVWPTRSCISNAFTVR